MAYAKLPTEIVLDHARRLGLTAFAADYHGVPAVIVEAEGGVTLTITEWSGNKLHALPSRPADRPLSRALSVQLHATPAQVLPWWSPTEEAIEEGLRGFLAWAKAVKEGKA